MSYAELICQSNFSFLQGASHPEELVQQASYLGYSAIAITDECSVAGVVRAHRQIKEESLKLKLIVGSRFVYQGELEFVLLAPSRQAYAELCRIITNARRRCEKGQYQLQEWDLRSIQHCFLLFIPSGQLKQDKYWLSWLTNLNKTIIKNCWLACRRHLASGEHHYLANLKLLAESFQLPIVATGQVLIHHKTRQPLLDVVHAIQHGCSVDKLGAIASVNGEASLKPLTTLIKLFEADWLIESLVIAKRCYFDLDELKYEYPSELIPNGETPTSYLKQLVEQGCQFRFPEGVPKDIQSIIDKELCLIAEMKYEHFFITIYDIIQFAKKQNILYQGRGSAANSIVCYCLEITAVDPSQISVLFERFISKERQEPPDIDVDFEHHRREEVFQYVYNKYGRKHTAIAATVITYRLKSAIREVGKALGLPETQLEFFIKNINRRHMADSWAEQLEELGLSRQSQKGAQFVELVNQIKGFPRHLSQHVGGFIISAGPLHELVPVENAAMAERTVIQWDKDDLETLELLKVDILALGMLSAIRRSFDLIKSHYQRSLSIAQITAMQGDPNVYDMIQQADTVGMFQIESRAQMSMLPRLKPTCYYDLVIQIAIVRPGPIQGGMVHPYLKRRDKTEPVSYPSKAVEEVLERTLGVPIFQEQVIKLAMVAAGFTGGEADQLRRAMGKWRRTGALGKFKQKLVDGMLERGYEMAFAERIFEQICGFGEYGFPESHSASFAVLAYVSAWLKYYYPEVFYCALLNSHPMGFYSPSQLLQDAKRHDVEVRPACINHSEWDHQLEKREQGWALRLGFRLVKGMRQESSEQLCQRRPATGFKSLAEVKQQNLNRGEMQALASANCFSSLSGDRFQTRWELMNDELELPLFAELQEPQNENNYQITPNQYEDLIEDYASLGLSLQHHPITLLQQAKQLGRYTPAAQLHDMKHGSLVTVVGIVTGRQSPGTASGVTFMTLEDDTGNINVIVWSATAKAQKKSFLTSKILKVKGILEKEGRVVHLVAGRLIDLSQQLDTLVTQSRDFH